ncbi:hypothetical protein CSUI_005805 [Cystoisospora suis]|uniref:Transmembrane protein n=1 Tax=Cystoisospora suis TaxID=483139 RepID=A0A2C6KIN1_9APIC|nr:hypothetical protein CSUI_005805 [Cystoisospora suis]
MNTSGVKMSAFAGAACFSLLIASVIAAAETSPSEDVRLGEGLLTSVGEPHLPITSEEEVQGSPRTRRSMMLARLGSSSTGLGKKFSPRTKLLAAIAGVALALGVGGTFWKCLKEMSTDNSGLSGKHCRELTEPESRLSIQASRSRPVISKQLIVSLVLLSAAALSFAAPVAHGGDHRHHHHHQHRGTTAAPTTTTVTSPETITADASLGDLLDLSLPPVKVEGSKLTIGDGWKEGEQSLEGTTVVGVDIQGKHYDLRLPASVENAFDPEQREAIIGVFKNGPSTEGNVSVWGAGGDSSEYTRWQIEDHTHVFHMPQAVLSVLDPDSETSDPSADSELDLLTFALAFAVEKGTGPTRTDYDKAAELDLQWVLKTEIKNHLKQIQTLVELL